MSQVVTITSQGQLTIPRSVREYFGMAGSTKAVLHLEGNKLIVEPQADFWSLSGALHSKTKLSDTQLRQARQQFSKSWARRP